MTDGLPRLSPGETAKHLSKIGEEISLIFVKLPKTLDNKNSVYYNAIENIKNYTILHLKIAAENINNHICILALSCRTIYELSIELRYIIQSKQNLENWLDENVLDEREIYTAFLKIENESGHDEDKFSERKKLIDNYVNNLPDLNIKKINSISKKVNSTKMEKEHDQYYKFMSKLIHPSSYIVNNSAASNDFSKQKILFLLQYYAYDVRDIISCLLTEITTQEQHRLWNGDKQYDE